jgi:adenosylhomocysteine nucleosidase
MTAQAEELEPLVAAASDARSVERGGSLYVCASLGDHDVVMTTSGGGPIRAAGALDRAIDGFQVSAVAVVGIAGGIGRDLHIGDVTIVAQWSRHDRDPSWHVAAAELLAAARRVREPPLETCDDTTWCAVSPRLAIGGNGVTGARFVADPAQADELDRRLAARVVDMETAAFAEVADRRHVPFIAVRAVSDVVRSGRSRELVEQHGQVAADNAATTAIELLRNLP